MKFSKQKHKEQNSSNADMAASAAVANVLLLKKRADDRQRAALRIKFEVSLLFFANLQVLDIIPFLHICNFSKFKISFLVLHIINVWYWVYSSCSLFNHILRPAATLLKFFVERWRLLHFFYLFFLLQHLAAAKLKLSSKRTMTEMVNWASRSTRTCWGSWKSLLHRW